MAKYYWLKLMDSFFGETYIKAMRSIPKGDSMVTAYLEMALHSLKTDGIVEYKGFMPTITEELAVAVSEPVALVKITLDILNKFGVVVIGEDKSAVFVEVVNNICSETPVAERVRNSRKRRAQQLLQSNDTETTEALQCNTDVTEELLHCNTEIDIDIEKELESDTDAPLPPSGRASPARESPDYKAIVEQFNSVCTALPKVRDLNEPRKKAIKSAVKRLGGEGLTELFRKTAASEFLCGKNGGWKASFDWILKPANITKIIEGNFDNSSPEQQTTDYTCGGKYVNMLALTGDLAPDDYPF